MNASNLPESGGLLSPDPYVELAMRPGDYTAEARPDPELPIPSGR